jgi:hypothetical protein
VAGTLTLSTLSDGTNSTNATDVIRGSARAWVNFNGVSGTSIRASYNVSSVTRASAGRYDVSFTNAMPDANYAVAAMLNGASGTGTGAFNANGLWGVNTRAAGSLRVEFYDAVGPSGYTDSALCDVVIFD